MGLGELALLLDWDGWPQWHKPTSSADTQTHILGLAHPNICSSMTSWSARREGLVLWNGSHRISMTQDYSRLYDRNFSESLVMTVCQGPWARPMTHGNERLQVSLNGQKVNLHNTPQLPGPLGWIKVCWKDQGAKWGFLVWFVFFLTNFGVVLLGGMLQGWGVDMEGLGGKQDSSVCCEILKDSIKSYVIKEREKLSLSLNEWWGKELRKTQSSTQKYTTHTCASTYM